MKVRSTVLMGMLTVSVLGSALAGPELGEKARDWSLDMVDPTLPVPVLHEPAIVCDDVVRVAWDPYDATDHLAIFFWEDAYFEEGLIPYDVVVESAADEYVTRLTNDPDDENDAGPNGWIYYRVHGASFSGEDGVLVYSPVGDVRRMFLDTRKPDIGEVEVVEAGDVSPTRIVGSRALKVGFMLHDNSIGEDVLDELTNRLTVRILDLNSGGTLAETVVDGAGRLELPVRLPGRPGRTPLRIVATDLAGNVAHRDVEDLTFQTREIVCYPNPFNPRIEECRLVYEQPRVGGMSLKIYDSSRHLVRELGYEASAGLVDGGGAAWDGRNGLGELVGDGVYFAVLEGSGIAEMKTKIVVAK